MTIQKHLHYLIGAVFVSVIGKVALLFNNTVPVNETNQEAITQGIERLDSSNPIGTK